MHTHVYIYIIVILSQIKDDLEALDRSEILYRLHHLPEFNMHKVQYIYIYMHTHIHTCMYIYTDIPVYYPIICIYVQLHLEYTHTS